MVVNNTGYNFSSSEGFAAASSMTVGSLKNPSDEIVDACNDRASAAVVFSNGVVGPATGHVISKQRCHSVGL